MTTSIWKLKNIVPITKMGVEATFAIASLATAITIIRNLKGTPPPLVFLGPSGPELAIFIICLFAAIAVLFIAAIYFAAAACASYQQMHKNEEISEAKAGAETAAKTEIEEKIKDLATKAELNNKADISALDAKADKTELNNKADKSEVTNKLDSGKFSEALKNSLEDPQVVQIFESKGFQKN
ncbi:hypothetical protein [Wolbachia endosymbiont of Nilaparvata lugens]|uniref:hypothetical protein n=1 Tax=Wolbachia endosymbiont of Nilaparvata lugens TaxID=357143 RepID=UPI00117F41E8|nr:hypothetical protein [Wolbachia endosymbiont of Nilaparvata lugens]